MKEADTFEQNQNMTDFDDHDQVWLFGYGSLIYKADFPYLEQKPASIRHWSRRFWQGSHDHRGTVEAPGRVVTLVEDEHAICEGMAYLVSPEVFEHLDHRERNGYLRITTELTFHDRHHAVGLVYIAGASNPAYLGPAPDEEIARQIAQSHGPSGSNLDYVLHLADALRELEVHDPHVFRIEKLLMEMEPILGHA